LPPTPNEDESASLFSNPLQKSPKTDPKTSPKTAETSKQGKPESEEEQNSGEFSEDDEMIYVPFEYEGDGRKREAKRHKSH